MCKQFWPTVLVAVLLSLPLAAQPVNADKSTHPKVRAVTAFVHLDRKNYREQVNLALRALRVIKEEMAAAGYEVETIRISSQPFTEIARGLSPTQTMNFFRDYDKLAQQEGFTPDIGPAMLHDSDDPTQAELLAQIIASTQTINGFVVVGDSAGIHWNGIHAAARVIKYLEDHTDRGEGNFRFAAGSFAPSNAPFFPVSYAQSTDRGFALGLESAGIVNQVFASAGGDLVAAGEQLRPLWAPKPHRLNRLPAEWRSRRALPISALISRLFR